MSSSDLLPVVLVIVRRASTVRSGSHTAADLPPLRVIISRSDDNPETRTVSASEILTPVVKSRSTRAPVLGECPVQQQSTGLRLRIESVPRWCGCSDLPPVVAHGLRDSHGSAPPSPRTYIKRTPRPISARSSQQSPRPALASGRIHPHGIGAPSAGPVLKCPGTRGTAECPCGTQPSCCQIRRRLAMRGPAARSVHRSVGRPLLGRSSCFKSCPHKRYYGG